MTTETRTTTVIQTEKTITKNEQVHSMHAVDKTGRDREGLYGMLCECKWAIVAIVFMVCVLIGLRPELVGLIVKIFSMAD